MIGHLGRDAEVNMHGSEVVINFSVAHTDKYKDDRGTPIQKATWVSCSWWTDKQAIVQYLKKGQMVWIEGFPEAKLWKDKKGGESRAFLNMRVLNLQLVGGMPQERGDSYNSPAQQSPTQPQNTYTPLAEYSDEPPF